MVSILFFFCKRLHFAVSIPEPDDLVFDSTDEPKLIASPSDESKESQHKDKDYRENDPI